MSNADLFINITNDAWFGDTPAPHQHAVLITSHEWGRPLLRIAYTGVSFVVEPHGAIKYETKPFVEEARVEELRLGKIQTLYRMGGWLFPWLGWNKYVSPLSKQRINQNKAERIQSKLILRIPRHSESQIMI